MADCWYVLHFHCPAPSTVLLQIRSLSNAVGAAKIAGGHPGNSVIYLRLGRSYLLQGSFAKRPRLVRKLQGMSCDTQVSHSFSTE